MILFLLGLAHAQPEVLPVQRVRFYETGVAWIEREGVVTDTTTLPVPRSHLDDALKTLVLLGGDVQVDAITFPSALGDAHARALAGLEEDGPVGFKAALQALLGVKVRVARQDGQVATGTLLDIEGPLPRANDKSGEGHVQPPQYALTLLDTKGVLQRVLTEDISQVRSTEADVSGRLQQAAGTLTQAAARQRNALNVEMSAGGKLALGYLTEAPVWRATYRLVDPGDGPARLQAWGIVHNDTDEDWVNVQIELVNGEPDSFLYPMAAPRYASRHLVTPEVPLSSVPQLATSTADEMWDDDDGTGTAMGLGGIGGRGYGSGGGSFGAKGYGRTRTAPLKEADPIRTPTQFVYRVSNALTLPARHSGLVPLIHGDVSAEPVVVFTPNSAKARLGVWLTNDTGKTLPAGVLSVLEAGGLGGESALKRLEPNASQMIQFGNELDVDLKRQREKRTVKDLSIAFKKDRIYLKQTTVRDMAMTVHNRSGRERTIRYALRLAPNDRLSGYDAALIDPHTGWTYVPLTAKTGETKHAVVVHEDRTVSDNPDGFSAQQYRKWAKSGLGDAQILNRAAAIRDRLTDVDTALKESQRKQEAAQKEVIALRKDLAAADGSDGTGSLSRRVTSVEQEIRQFGEHISRMTTRREETVRDLTRLVSELSGAVADATRPND